MKCSLCDQPIKDYLPEWHHLKIDDTHAADICSDCMDKIVKKQGSIIAKLFPTSALKKRNDRNR
ncbi:MAG: hypothetical protein V1837_02900 [Candidatus Woesearchaeota archaeon]